MKLSVITHIANDGGIRHEFIAENIEEANARLIAASPVLLQACRDALAVLSGHDEIKEADMRARLKKAIWMAVNQL